jgi:hypothetical protein
MTEDEVEMTVRALLKASGLNLTDEQIAGYVRVYPVLRAGADSLYIPEARYETPALIFSAALESAP